MLLNQPSRLSVVVDGQFGSCGKGAIAGYLSRPGEDPRQVVVVRVGGPNAGHTVYGPCPTAELRKHNSDPTDSPLYRSCDDCDQHGHPWRLRQIPVGAVTNPNSRLVIAAGSEIDLEVLQDEMRQLDNAGIRYAHRLYIDSSATILTGEHRLREAQASLNERVGSTGKGIGAARADRIMRTAQTVAQYIDEFYDEGDGSDEHWLNAEGIVCDTTRVLRDHLLRGAHVVIEATQGYGLGLHTRYYPQTTSGDCRAIDVLAQAGISPWGYTDLDFKIWVVVRPNPIRVAGNSGPLHGETTWEALGLPQERTTVTKKVRRVGTWDDELVREAVLANGGGDPRNPFVGLAITMGDHINDTAAGVTDWQKLPEDVLQFAADAAEQTNAPVWAIGTSPVTLADLRPKTLDCGCPTH